MTASPGSSRPLTPKTERSITKYDAAGNLISRLDARSPRVETAFSYDDLNRVTSRSYSDGTPAVDYFYDDQLVPNSKGKLTKVDTIGVSTTNYTNYDELGRLTAYNQVTAGRTYLMSCAYNLAGIMTSEIYGEGDSLLPVHTALLFDAAVRASAECSRDAAAVLLDVSFEY